MTNHSPPHDGRWRALIWLAFGDAVLLFSGILLVLSPLLLIFFLSSPLLLAIFALPSLSWFFYGLMVLRARAVPPPSPVSGEILLDPERYPALVRDLERLRLACDAPGFTEVYVNAELNASIYQKGSRSGSRKHILVLGLPLLALLTKAQAEAVLVHEYAHISRLHGHFARWAYMARQRWARLGELHERNHRLITAPLRLFLSWYVPRMMRETLEFSRRCEKVADAQAVEICGSELALEAELALALRQKAMAESFWPGIFEGAGEADLGSARPFTELLAEPATSHPRDGAQAAVWLHERLCERPDPGSTHPSLFERVETTGFDPSGPLPDRLPWRLGQASAAASWLGKEAPALATQLDENWRENAVRDWRNAKSWQVNRHDEFKNLLHRRRQQLFDEQDWLQLALLAKKFDQTGVLRAEVITEGLQHFPEDPALLQLKADDLEQAGDIRETIALWHRIGQPASSFQGRAHRRLCELYLRQGDKAAAEHHRHLADQLWASPEVRQPAAAGLFPHGMEASELALLQSKLQPLHQHARAIWLCRDTPPNSQMPTRWFLYVEAYDGWLMRLVGRLTGEKDYNASACERLIERLWSRLHIHPEVRFIGSSDEIPACCSTGSLIARGDRTDPLEN